MCCFSRTHYSLSVPGKQEWAWAARSSQDWDHEKGHLLGFLSVTRFSDSLQWPYSSEIYSVMPLLLRIWMLSGPLKIVICLALFLFNFFYCLKLPCMKIYKHVFLQIKHPCFTWDLGRLHPSRQLQSLGPSLQRPWHPTISCHVRYNRISRLKKKDREWYTM